MHPSYIRIYRGWVEHLTMLPLYGIVQLVGKSISSSTEAACLLLQQYKAN